MTELPENTFTEVIKVGEVTFIFFPGDGGGRLIPVRHIKSIMPDFKGHGSMVFLTESDKAVKVQQLPVEIVDDIIKES